MTRLEEIRERLNSAKACSGDEAQARHDLSYLLELVEKQREALDDISEKSQAPFISDRADMNLKWLRVINEIAKEALAKEIGE